MLIPVMLSFEMKTRTWKELDFNEQIVYIRQAEYIQEKGYFPEMTVISVAEILYYRDEKVESDK
jgi:hypothetical protein